jgi:alkylation response protein AidB-like acyl-CoA dehydrogenase
MTVGRDDQTALLAAQVCDFLTSLIKDLDSCQGADEAALSSMIEAMGEKGFLGILAPEHYGGGGGGWVETAVVVEEVAALQSNLAAMLTAHYACLGGIVCIADRSQAEVFVPALASCEVVGAVALTEPEAGTDLGAMRVKLEKRGEDLLVNGNKCFVTNTGPELKSGVLTFCKHDGEAAAVYILSSDPGFHIDHRYRFAGWDNLPNHAIVLEDCLLPGNRLIKEVMEAEDWDAFFAGPRLLVSATAAGMCRACLDEAACYARERRQFGKPLASHQALRFRLADMATSYEVLSAGIHGAASMLDAGGRCVLEINMLKLFSTTRVEEVASSALEMAGGYGYTEDCGLSRLYRDAKGLQLYWGSRERMRMDIAAALGTR